MGIWKPSVSLKHHLGDRLGIWPVTPLHSQSSNYEKSHSEGLAFINPALFHTERQRPHENLSDLGVIWNMYFLSHTHTRKHTHIHTP